MIARYLHPLSVNGLGAIFIILSLEAWQQSSVRFGQLVKSRKSRAVAAPA